MSSKRPTLTSSGVKHFFFSTFCLLAMVFFYSILEFCFYSHLLECEKKGFALDIKWSNLNN